MNWLKSSQVQAILLILLICFVRLLWLRDMEFKADEMYTARYLATLSSRPFTPATDPSGHSGVTLSNGFYYFLNLFPVNYSNPLNIIRMIAGLNAAVVGLGLWLLRKSRTGFLTFALIGTSVTLIQGSRKIWYPDLVPFWCNLGLACFLVSAEVSARSRKDAWLALAAFCFAVAGHMYMPGLMIGGAVSATVFLTFLVRKEWRSLLSWSVGLFAAALTWIPYLIFMFSGSGAYGRSSGGFHPDWMLVEPILRHTLTLPSTFPFYGLYLRALPASLQDGYGARPFLFLVGVVLVGLFWASLIALTRTWRSWKTNPLIITLLSMLVLIPVALFVSHLGSYVHYWLGVMPFAYYLIAWVSDQERWPHFALWMRRFAWTACLLSVISALSFSALVHKNNGLPGEYGPSYRSRFP